MKHALYNEKAGAKESVERERAGLRDEKGRNKPDKKNKSIEKARIKNRMKNVELQTKENIETSI